MRDCFGREAYYQSVRLRIIRFSLWFALIAFFLDGLVHPYTWPGEVIQPHKTERMVRVLWTHSREGNDTWMMLLCLLVLFWIWQREQANHDDPES
jgi:hypothetical protein